MTPIELIFSVIGKSQLERTEEWKNAGVDEAMIRCLNEFFNVEGRLQVIDTDNDSQHNSANVVMDEFVDENGKKRQVTPNTVKKYKIRRRIIIEFPLEKLIIHPSMAQERKSHD